MRRHIRLAAVIRGLPLALAIGLSSCLGLLPGGAAAGLLVSSGSPHDVFAYDANGRPLGSFLWRSASKASSKSGPIDDFISFHRSSP